MGSPLSPIIANLYMEHFEQEAIRLAADKPKFCVRYSSYGRMEETAWPYFMNTLTDYVTLSN